MAKTPGDIATRIFAVVLVLIGAAYAVGGAQLLSLGGSPYFLVTGLAVLVVATLTWRGNALGAWLYVVMLAWTTIWAVMEAGVDFWGLLPRLFGPYLFGLYFLTPWYRRSVRTGWQPRRGRRGTAAVFAATIAGLVVWGAVAGDPYRTYPTQGLPAVAATYQSTSAPGDWPHYGNDEQGTRFSRLTQIGPNNVDRLQVAWTYRTGEYPPAKGEPVRRFEGTPLKIDGTLYFCTSESNVIALDAATGKQIWRSPAGLDTSKVLSSAPCRGVAYYAVPAARQNRGQHNRTGDVLCANRIIAPVVDGRLRAMDARTGEACAGFGNRGEINLKGGMGTVVPGYYYLSSAPEIVRGRVVMGGRIMDGQSTREPSGVIRAFDAVTGAFSWAFDMGRIDDHAMPGAGQQYTRGTPNSWAPLSADERLGMVYLPIGNAPPDFWGGHRRAFDNRFSSSVIALDAETGALHWSYQTTHYDLWDMDVPAQPSLIDLTIGGRTVPALVQLTKRGQTFVLDRRTGKPVFRVEERPAPRGGVEDTRLSRTQPWSVEMPDFSGANPTKPKGIDEADAWGITPFDLMWCRIKFKQARFDGTLTPPGLEPTLQFPGSFGGVNWGGGSFDAERKILVSNWSRFPFMMQLIARSKADAQGVRPYDGTPASQANGGILPQIGTPYAVKVSAFLSPIGVPCTAPPYQMVTAVDLTTKRVLWSTRSGTARDTGFTVAGHRFPSMLPIAMGPPGIGGSMTTRSGLVFIAASGEQSLRAMDLATGQILWAGRLPAGGDATPITYEQDGRQYVVIAAGGHNQLGTKPGDYVIAFALPQR